MRRVSQEKDSHEKDSHEKDSHEKDSHENVVLGCERNESTEE